MNANAMRPFKLSAKGALAVLLSAALLLGMLPFDKGMLPAFAAGAGSSTIERDPGNTGGADTTVRQEGNTIVFGGKIDYYKADESVGRMEAGNRVGVKITAPAGLTTESAPDVRISILPENGEARELGREALDSAGGEDAFFYYYPLVTGANQQYAVTVDWDGDGGLYAEESFSVQVQDAVLIPGPTVLKQDDKKTGGVTAVWEEESGTLTVSGNVEYWNAGEGDTRPSGHYIGAKVTAPAGLTMDAVKDMELSLAGEEITNPQELIKEQNGELYVAYLPLVTAPGQSFSIVVDWDGAGDLCQPETLAIKVDPSVRLKVGLEMDIIPDSASYPQDVEITVQMKGLEDAVPAGGKLVLWDVTDPGQSKELAAFDLGKEQAPYQYRFAAEVKDYSFRADYEGDGVYAAASGSYIAYNVAKGQQSIQLAEGQKEKMEKIYGESEFSIAVTGGNPDTATRLESSAPDVISVKNGRLQILAPGTADITVYKEGNDNYQESNRLTVTVEVSKKQLTIKNPDELQIEPKVYDGTINAALSSAPVVEGVAGGDSVKLNYTARFADKNAGVHEVEVVYSIEGKDADNYIVPASVKKLGTVDKKPLRVRADDVIRKYGQGNGTLTVSYEADDFVKGESPDNIAGWVAPVASCEIDSRAESDDYVGVILVSGGQAANYLFVYTPGNLKITRDSSENRYEMTFPNENGWYIKEENAPAVRIKPKDANTKISLVPSNVDGADHWREELTFSEDGIYDGTDGHKDKIVFYLMDGTGAITKPQEVSLRIDSTPPEFVKIEYGTPVENFLDALTFGAYYNVKGSLPVRVYAEDKTSGVAELTYALEVDPGAESGENKGATLINEDSNTAFMGTFEIMPQFRGRVTVSEIKDRAGNKWDASHTDDTTLIVDTIAPEITVRYYDTYRPDCAEAQEGYFNDKREAKLIIKEANFDQSQVTLNLQKDDVVQKVILGGWRFNEDSQSYTGEILNIGEIDPNRLAGMPQIPTEWEYTQKGYVASITYSEEGNYRFAISCTDGAGNANSTVTYRQGDADTGSALSPDAFVIDKTGAAIQVEYKNEYTDITLQDYSDTCFSVNQRTAVITIDEHNFDANAVQITLKKDGKAYQDLPGNPEWKKDNGRYSREIPLTEEGEYYFTIAYVDQAGNPTVYTKGEGTERLAEYGEDIFFIDRTAPSWPLEAPECPIVFSSVEEGGKLITMKAEGKNYVIAQKGIYTEIPSVLSFDTLAGISQIKYSLWEDDEKVREIVLKNENGGSFSRFITEPQFRGQIRVEEITDRAGNVWKEGYTDERILLVDDSAPKVTVTYEDSYDFGRTGPKHGYYFNGTRKAEINVEESNFDLSEVSFTITFDKSEAVPVTLKNWRQDAQNAGLYLPEITYPQGMEGKVPQEIKDIIEKAKWRKTAENHYSAELVYEAEGDYTFAVSGRDAAGNESEISYAAGNPKEANNQFTIDETRPLVRVEYVNDYTDDALKDYSGRFFSVNQRTVVISIDERNFNKEHPFHKEDIQITLQKDGVNYPLPDYLKWEEDGSRHVLTIPLTEEGGYTFAIQYEDMAGNPALYSKAGGNTETSEYEPDAFTIDRTAPELEISVGGSDNVWKNLFDQITFGLFFQDTVTVHVKTSDEKTNGEGNQIGVSSVNEAQDLLYQKVKSEEAFNPDGPWTVYNEFTVAPNEKFIVYAQSTDRAGNVTLLHSNGAIVDNQAPVGQGPELTITPEAPNANGFYNRDVGVSIDVYDPNYSGGYRDEANGVHSGLKKVSYEVLAGNSQTQAGVLFEFNKENPKYEELEAAFHHTIVVDAQKNNSNHVLVRVTASDNAGNIKVSEIPLKIDVTKPVIDVVYNNNDARNTDFFKADRVATVTIDELNFKGSEVRFSIQKDGVEQPGLYPTSWSTAADGKTRTATIAYTSDGDYTFSVQYTDLAGNTADYDRQDTFTLDKTLPKVGVAYNNNDAQNGNYYKEGRTATITIEEHNFDPAEAVVTLTATDNGSPAAVPTVNGWSSAGDSHTATVVFDKDAQYTISVGCTDKAGNASEPFAEQTFVVDTTAPELSITGIKDESANKGEVAPTITYSDTNFDADAVQITLFGSQRQKVTPQGSYSSLPNGQVFQFSNFEKKKEFDDIYTLTATLRDKAGNETTQTLRFSVNRFGSTYEYGDEKTQQAIQSIYNNRVGDIVMTEINPDILKSYSVKYSRNGEIVSLKEKEDFAVTMSGGKGEWKKYTYTIFADNFEQEGNYIVTLYSQDAAENTADNKSREKSVQFSVDRTAPTCVVSGVEENGVYNTNEQPFTLAVKDNMQLKGVTVKLDGKELTAREGEIQGDSGELTFSIPSANAKQHLEITCVDQAGNEGIPFTADVLVTTNLMIRYYENKPLFIGSLVVLGLMLAGAASLIILKRKKKNEQNL